MKKFWLKNTTAESENETPQIPLIEEQTEAVVVEPLVRVKPSLSKGLSDEAVKNRIENGAVNIPVKTDDLTLKDIVKENVFTYFNLIFLIIAILLIVVGSFRDLTFLPVIISNA